MHLSAKLSYRVLYGIKRFLGKISIRCSTIQDGPMLSVKDLWVKLQRLASNMHLFQVNVVVRTANTRN